MGDNNQITTYFGADISELRKAMQDAKKSIALANSEFKVASAECGKWSESSEGLTAKIKNLTTTVENQKTMLAVLEEEYRQVCASQGETSNGAKELKIKILDQQAAIVKNEKSIKYYGESLGKVTEAEKRAAKTGQDISEVLDEMKGEAKAAGDRFAGLKNDLQKADQTIAVANSEFEAAASACKDWTKESSGLNAKLKQLGTVLGAQKSALATLEEQYKRVRDEQGDNSAAAQDLVVKINKQKAAINKTQREISGFESSLQEVTQAEKISAKTGKSVNEVLDEMKKESDDAGNGLDNVGKSAENAGDGFTTLKGAIATFAGNMLTNLVGSVKNGISNIMGLAEETREYRSELGKLETAFTTAGHTTEAATKTYKDLYTVLGDEGQTTEAVNHLAKLCNTEEELAAWTNIATGVYGTFGDSLPIEGLTEAANETAKTGAITGGLADALNWAGVSEESFQGSLDACSSEQERQALITETLNGLYTDAANKYKETNKSVMDANRAQSDYTDTLAAMGEKIEPVTTALKQGFAGLLGELLKLFDGVDVEGLTAKIQKAFEWVRDNVVPYIKEKVIPAVQNLVDKFKENVVPIIRDKVIPMFERLVTRFKEEVVPWIKDEIIPILEKLVAKFKDDVVPILEKLLPIIESTFGWLIDNKELVLAALVAIAGGFAAFKVVTLIQSVTKALNAMTIAQYALNLAQNLNPMGLIVAAIAALVVGFITLWNTSDGFREFWINLWEKITDACSTAKEWIGNAIDEIGKFFTETLPNAFKSVIDWIKENWTTILTFLVNPFAGLFKYFYENNGKFKEFVDTAVKFIKELPGKVWTWLVNTINKVNTWRQNMINKAKDAALNFINKVVEFVKQLPGKVWTWLVNVVSKVTTWASNMKTKAKEAASNFINRVIDYIKQLPGKVWTWLSNVISKVSSWASDLVNKGKNAASNFINNVIDKVKQLPGKFGTWLTNALSKVTGWASDLASKGKDAASKLLNSVVDKVKEIPGKLASIGEDIVKGLWNGINDTVSWLKNKISGFVGNVTDWLKDFFQIGSPSKLMANEVGKWLPEGIAVGVDKNSKGLLNSMQDLAVNTVGAARDGLSSASSSIGGSVGARGGIVNNFTQVINSPKQLSRLDIYRQSKNLLGYAGGA